MLNAKAAVSGLLRPRACPSHRWPITSFNPLHPVKGKVLIGLCSTGHQLKCSPSLSDAGPPFPLSHMSERGWQRETDLLQGLRHFQSFEFLRKDGFSFPLAFDTFINTFVIIICCSFELNANHRSLSQENHRKCYIKK